MKQLIILIAFLMFASPVFAQETMDKTCWDVETGEWVECPSFYRVNPIPIKACDVKQDLIELLEEYIKTCTWKEVQDNPNVLTYRLDAPTLEGFLEWLKRK